MRKVLILIVIASTFLTIEFLSFLGSLILAKNGVFFSPKYSPDISKYLRERDPHLGWPSPANFGKGNLASDGSRLSPAFPNTSYNSCVSVYGDSFAWADEVDNSEAWGNLLALKLSCRVANFGVGGYGTDQAFMRFKGNVNDSSPHVILTFLSENILRNINQFRDLIYPNDGLGFKPRFILDSQGKLELVPIPTITSDSYPDFLSSPERYLQHEYFMPGRASGLQAFRFPYTLGIIKSFRHYHIRSRLRNRPRYMEFFAANHPAAALELTARILGEFGNLAKQRNKSALVLVIPTAEDLRYRLKSGAWPFEALLPVLRGSNVNFLNFGDAILNQYTADQICALYTNCSGHLSSEGNYFLAEVVFNALNL